MITSAVEFTIKEHAETSFGPIYYSVFNYSGEHSSLELHTDPLDKKGNTIFQLDLFFVGNKFESKF